jgi:hypothetical protein
MWTRRQRGSTFHLMSPPCRASLAYKYIIKSGDKVTWQPCENLTVQVPPEANAVQIKDDWTGKDRSVDLSDTTADELPVTEELPVLSAEMSDSSAAAPAVVEDGVDDSSSDVEGSTDPFVSTTSADSGVEGVLEQVMEQELSQVRADSQATHFLWWLGSVHAHLQYLLVLGQHIIGCDWDAFSMLQTSIENLSVDKLKDHLQKRGLSAKGRKEQKQSVKAAPKAAGPMPNNGRTRSAAWLRAVMVVEACQLVFTGAWQYDIFHWVWAASGVRMAGLYK